MDKTKIIHVPIYRADCSDYGWDYYEGDLFCKYCGNPNLYEADGGDFYYPTRYYCPHCKEEWSE